MKYKNLCILGLVFVSFTLLLADEKEFEIKLPGYPRTSATCQITAEKIADQFSAQTSVSFAAKVIFEKRTGCDIQLKYRAETRLDLYSNAVWPVNESYDQCIQSFSSEEVNFSAISGLRPFFRFCGTTLESSNLTGKPIRRYAAVMYVYGKPKSINRSLTFRLDDGDFVGDKSVLQEIVVSSNRLNIPVSRIRVDNFGGSAELWVELNLPFSKAFKLWNYEYLLKSSIEPMVSISTSLGAADPLISESVAQCSSQAEAAKSIFGKAFSNPAVWMCTWNPYLYKSRLHHLRIKPGSEYFERIVPGADGEPFTNVYSSKGQCEADKTRVLAYYRKKYPSEFVGALCSWPLSTRPGTPIKMFLYTKHD